MIDISRRFFVFGAAATLILPPKRTFHILPPPAIIRPVASGSGLLLDLPLQQMMDLLTRLDQQAIDLRAIPRWLVINKEHYDLLVRS